jgi:glutamyl-tRNA reductase
VAPVEIREALFPGPERIEEFFEAARDGRFKAEEAAMVFTCSRVEFYLVSSQASLTASRVRDWFLNGAGHYRDHTFALAGDEAVEHLLAVCAGLDSIMLGEHEILGQVRHSLEQSQERGTVGPVLERFLQAGLRTGRRARQETEIGKGGTSLAFAAADTARSEVPPSQRGRAVIVGAGQTGAMAATHLSQGGWSEILILNRTLDRAESLADRVVGARALPLDDLQWAIRGARVVVTAAGGNRPLITGEVMTDRSEKPVMMLDLGRPRNIDAAVGLLPGVQLTDLDRLQDVADTYRQRRALEIPLVEPIVAEEATKFRAWLAHRAVIPMVKMLRGSFTVIAEQELKNHRHHFPEAEQEKLERYTRSLLNKLLHYPTAQLKELAEVESGEEDRLSALQEIFVSAGWDSDTSRKEAS